MLNVTTAFGKQVVVVVDKRALAGIAVVVVAAVVLTFSGAFATPQSHSSEPVRLGYLPVGPYALSLFTAIDKGYFADEGINVTITRMESPNQLVESLVSGRTDAGDTTIAAGITAIADDKQPGVLKVFALACGTTQSEHLVEELVVSPNSTVASFADLRGKKMAIIPSAQWSTISKFLFNRSGLAPGEASAEGIILGSQLPALSQGSVDAVLALEPAGSIAEGMGVGKIVERAPLARALGGYSCLGAGVVSAKFAAERPREAAAFVRAIRRAIADVNAGRADRRLMTKYLAVPPEVAAKTPLPVYEGDPAKSKEISQAYQRLLDMFYDYNATSTRVNAEGLYWRGA